MKRRLMRMGARVTGAGPDNGTRPADPMPPANVRRHTESCQACQGICTDDDIRETGRGTEGEREWREYTLTCPHCGSVDRKRLWGAASVAGGA